MNSFNDKMRLKENAEEDIYFSRLDRELIAALRSKFGVNSSKQTLPANDGPTCKRDKPADSDQGDGTVDPRATAFK